MSGLFFKAVWVFFSYEVEDRGLGIVVFDFEKFFIIKFFVIWYYGFWGIRFF